MVWNAFLEDEEVQDMTEPDLRCSECNGKSVALIFWGYPADMRELEKEIEENEIVLGGCLVTDHDPKWECTDCHHRWGEREDD
jgi:hypothetical protein